jgi:hypothetical protein
VSPRYVVLSLVALFVIFLLILKNYETWTRPIETTPERNTAKKQEAKIENPSASRPQTVGGSAQVNIAIAGKNIFSPERKDFLAQSSEARKLVRPQIILYGVTISDGSQFASIVNPGRPLLRGERETMSLKVGDKIGGYKLAKITSDRITLEAEGDTFEVLLYDPTMPKKRMNVKTETKPATITSAQPPPAGPVPRITLPTPSSTFPGVAKPSTPPQAVAPRSPAITGPVTPPSDVRRGRRIYYPPTGTLLSPGSQPSGAGENQ